MLFFDVILNGCNGCCVAFQQVSQLMVYHHYIKYGAASGVTGSIALGASVWNVNILCLQICLGEIPRKFGRNLGLLFAVRTESPDKTLGDDYVQGCSDRAQRNSEILQAVFVDGLEDALRERSWNRENFDDETAMLTSAEIRMGILQAEYEECGNNGT